MPFFSSQPSSIVILGDATGASVGGWVRLLAADLTRVWPTARIEYLQWGSTAYSTAKVLWDGGGSTLTIYNGSVIPDAEYHDGAAGRLAAMVPVTPDALIVSHGHSHGSDTVATFEGKLDALLSAVETLRPGTPVVISSQNHEKSPYSTRVEHNARQAALAAYASANSYGYINTYETFLAHASPDSLVKADGASPTDSGLGDGSHVWAGAAKDFLAGADSAAYGALTFAQMMAALKPEWWARLGESCGTTMTGASGNARDGTYYNSPTLGVAGAVADGDTAVDFNGTNQYGEVAYGSWMNPTAFDYTLLAFAASTDNDGLVIGRSSSGTHPYALSLSSGSGAYFETRSTGSGWYARDLNTTGARDGNWHFLVGTSRSGYVTVFVDGVQAGQNSGGSGPSGNPLTTTSSLNVARRVGGPYLDGSIDEPALFHHALTPQQIADLYDKASSAVVPSLAPPAATSTAAASVPNVALSTLNLSTPVATAAATAIAATISLGFSAPVAEANGQAHPPTVAVSAVELAPPAATATAQGREPAIIVGGVILAPGTATANAQAHAPTIQLGTLTLTPDAATATTVGHIPAVSVVTGVDLASPTATVAAAAQAPSVAVITESLVPSAASASAATLAPTVDVVVVVDALVEFEVEYDLDFDVRPPGTLANPLAPTYPATVDLADAVLVVTDPAHEYAAAPSVWMALTTTSVSTTTLTWAGSGSAALEIWMASDVLGTWDPGEVTLVASSDTGSVSWSSGEGSVYYVRVYPLGSASEGTVSFASVDRDPSGDLQAELVEQDGYVFATESWLAISVLNATDSGALSFEVDGTPISFSATVGESGAEAVITVPLPTLTAGNHSVTVIDDATGQSATVAFPVMEIMSTPDTGPLAPPTTTPTERWSFIDPAGLEATYDFAINPSTMTSPHPQRLVTADHTTHPDGQAILFEGRSAATSWTVEGTSLAVAQYNRLEAFLALPRQFWVVDHVNRAWLLSLESIDWTDVRSTNHPDAMKYVMKFLIYEGPVTV